MNGFTYAVVIVAVIAVVAGVYGAWRYWQQSPSDVARDAASSETVGGASLGPHSNAQDPSWVNRNRSGNWG